MGSWTITKRELKNTFYSRKFIFIFFFQLLVLLGMILFFNSFMEGIDSDEEISLTPSLNQFASLGIYDPQNILKPQLNPEILELKPINKYNELEDGGFTGLILLNTSDDSELDKIQPIGLQLYLDYRDPKRTVIRDEVELAREKASLMIAQKWIMNFYPQEELALPQVEKKVQGEDITLQIITKLMTAILIFLPLFLFGNLIVDSIVGEKERKTWEILIAMPISRSNIILGKIMAVIITIAVQIALWIILMILAGYSLENPVLVYFVVLSTAIPLVGVTGIIASYANNYKEAGIGITFAYIAMITFLIVPTLVYFSLQGRYVSSSPMILVIKLVSKESLSGGDILLTFTSLLLLSLTSYYIFIWLFHRDDIVFGPRPGLSKLIFDFLGLNKICGKFKKNKD